MRRLLWEFWTRWSRRNDNLFAISLFHPVVTLTHLQYSSYLSVNQNLTFSEVTYWESDIRMCISLSLFHAAKPTAAPCDPWNNTRHPETVVSTRTTPKHPPSPLNTFLAIWTKIQEIPHPLATELWLDVCYPPSSPVIFYNTPLLWT